MRPADAQPLVRFIALFDVRLLPCQFRPLPQPGRDFPWEPLPQLTRSHAQLATVMTLVCSKVAQEVLEVRWEVLPRGPRYTPTVRDAKLNQLDHALATARQRL